MTPFWPLILTLFAFQTGGPVRFAQVTIRPSAAPPAGHAPTSLTPGRMGAPDKTSWSALRIPFSALIMLAYPRFNYAGPKWLETQFFDIDAKIPQGTTKDQVPLMLQSLLEERFRLKFHYERKQQNGLELRAVEGGSKLRDIAGQPATEAAEAPLLRVAGERATTAARSTAEVADGHLRAEGLRIKEIVNLLRNLVQQPIEDAAGLTGRYSFEVDWTPDREKPFRGLTAALEREVGLRLVPRKMQAEVLVVDHIEKKPEN